MLWVSCLLSLLLSVQLSRENEVSLLEELSAEQWEALGDLSTDVLPEAMKQLLRLNRAATGSSQWCCNINPTKTIISTHTHLQYRQTSHKEKHYTSCKLWGWSRCSTYTTRYARATYYSTVYSKRVVPTTCPHQHVTCCKGYVLVANNCLDVTKLPDVTSDILKLQQGGYLDKVVG